MQSAALYAIISVLLTSLVSFVGLVTLSIKTDKLKKILLYVISFSAGGLFGDAFLHLLPQSVVAEGFTINISLFVLSGVSVFFLLEKVVKWHHYHYPHTNDQIHPFAITNLVGDGFHNLIDGLIIGASYMVSIPVGIATTIAVVFHEIPQEIGDFGILIQGGFTKEKALIANFATALMSVIGVILALFLGARIEGLTMFLIPFAAGGFIYIAGSDLIPELHKEVNIKKSFVQFISFILGIGVMYLLLFIE